MSIYAKNRYRKSWFQYGHRSSCYRLGRRLFFKQYKGTEFCLYCTLCWDIRLCITPYKKQPLIYKQNTLTTRKQPPEPERSYIDGLKTVSRGFLTLFFHTSMGPLKHSWVVCITLWTRSCFLSWPLVDFKETVSQEKVYKRLLQSSF